MRASERNCVNEIFANKVKVQQFNPWPRKREERRQRERGKKEEQEQAGAASLHLWNSNGGEGLPVAFSASPLTSRAAVHHMGFGLP